MRSGRANGLELARPPHTTYKIMVGNILYPTLTTSSVTSNPGLLVTFDNRDFTTT